jgi:DNA-binding MarR family transcriptional regulator
VHDVRDLMSVVTNNNLSRSHRALLLLADGSHNVLDLARLASKSVDDVTHLLAELEGRGLIYYYE